MKKLQILLPMLLLAAICFAQQKTITGTVVAKSNNQPLVGVSVQNGTKTVLTDANGKFSIAAISGDKITLSYVGMNDLTIDVTASTQDVNLAMVEGSASLNQVVVVGYTSQRKQDLTGSVAVVELTPTVKNNTSGNTMQALQGRVAGLYIEKDGSPNGTNSRILIRGANSLNYNNPLYIIDGISTTRPEVFQSLDPAIIQSVQILKDASSESIYGARASNGVIIVTTRNGGNSDGKVQFQVNSSASLQSEKSMRFKMLNSLDRGKALWQASVNDQLLITDPASRDSVNSYGDIYFYNWNHDFSNPVLNSVNINPFVGGDPNTPVGNTDWQDVMYKTGFVTSNSFTASYGTRNASVLVNFNHYKNDGMLRYTGYERTSGSINGAMHAFNNIVTLGVNLRVANSNENLTTTDIGGAATTFLAVTLAPTIPVFQKDGVTYAGELGAGYSDRNNPLHMQYLARWNNTNRLNTFGNLYAEIQPIKNLYFRTNFGVDDSRYLNKTISPTFTEGALSRTTNSLLYDQNHFTGTTFSNTIRYNLDLNSNHHFRFLVGTEYIKNNTDLQRTLKEGFAIQTEDYFTLSSATGNTKVSGQPVGSSLFSQFGRVDYNFDDKYLAAFTLRRDGSSRFGSNNQYGVFPAASVGWKIDKEAFMQTQDFISELKLRAGVGRVGNQEGILEAQNLSLYGTRYGTTQNELTPGFWEQYMNIGTAYSLYGANTGNLPSGYVLTQQGNANLKWEQTDELNVGLDFTVFQKRIYGSFDYFTRKTTGILIQPKVAGVLGEGKQQTVNGASKHNKGWEAVIGYQGAKGKDFSYDVKANFAHFRDKVTDLPVDVQANYPGNPGNTILGHSQFDIFGYETDGLFQSQEEVDKAAKQIGAAPGRIRYKDLNGDGKIDTYDQDWFGTTLPKLEYGLRIDLTYKKFDVALFGSGVAGRKGFDAYSLYDRLMRSRENVGPGVFDAWTPQHTNTDVPALTLQDINGETRQSDYFFVNTSYFKMRNIQVGYSFTSLSIFSRLRFFAMAENLFWFKSSEYKSPDPERIDLNPVPIPKTFTIGLNASF